MCIAGYCLHFSFKGSCHDGVEPAPATMLDLRRLWSSAMLDAFSNVDPTTVLDHGPGRCPIVCEGLHEVLTIPPHSGWSCRWRGQDGWRKFRVDVKYLRLWIMSIMTVANITFSHSEKKSLGLKHSTLRHSTLFPHILHPYCCPPPPGTPYRSCAAVRSCRMTPVAVATTLLAWRSSLVPTPAARASTSNRWVHAWDMRVACVGHAWGMHVCLCVIGDMA